jgi:sugar phosphate permease
MSAPQPTARLVPYRWLVFGLLSAAYLLVYFHRLSPAVLAIDMMKDLAAGGTLIGVLGSAYFYPYAFMQLPAGLLTDSWGPRRTVAVSFILAGGASIFLGWAPNVSWAIGARVLVGLGVSMLFVPTMKILTQWFRRSDFAFMTGLLMAMGGLGVLSAAAPLAYISTLVGWRGSFQVIGVATLLLAAAIWFLVRNTPAELGFPPPEDSQQASGTNGPAVKIGLWAGLKMVLRRGAFWPLAMWFFFTAGVFFAFGGLWGGPYLMHVYGLTKSEAGNVLSMLAVGMIIGSPLLSYLSDRLFHSRKKLMLATSVIMVMLTAQMVFAPKLLSLPWLYVFCFLISLCSSAIVVIGFTSSKELFPVSIAGTAVGAVNLFPFLGGAILQPLVGFLLERFSQGGAPYPAQAYGRAFVVLLVSSVLALVMAALQEETYPGAQTQAGGK